MLIRRPNTVAKVILGQRTNSLFSPGDIALFKIPAATNLLQRI